MGKSNESKLFSIIQQEYKKYCERLEIKETVTGLSAFSGGIICAQALDIPEEAIDEFLDQVEGQNKVLQDA